MKKNPPLFDKDDIRDFLRGKKRLFDIGSGPEGSDWWEWIDEGAEIVGIDTGFFPKTLPKHVRIYQYDAQQLKDLIPGQIVERHKPNLWRRTRRIKESVAWDGVFDIVIARHVLEHVQSPEAVVAGMAKILCRGGIVYTGFPDGKNFTDTFYHLIHAEGGGHIQRLAKSEVEAIFKRYGFRLVKWALWPDDWRWFHDLYDYKARNIQYINQDDIDYLTRVFRKEFTWQKGYFYGWEMVFQKK